MIYVSICDDDKRMAKRLEALVSKEFSSRGYCCKCSVYFDGKSFLEQDREQEQELIFLDIEMPGVSGMQIAEYLQERGRSGNVVFVTGYENLVFQSQKYFPFYFLRKSELEEKAGKLVEEFLRRLNGRQEKFMVTAGKTMFTVLTSEIMYLTYHEHKIRITMSGHEKYEFRGSLKVCEQKLKKDCFYRINSATIINFSFVKVFEGSDVIMDDNEKIWISREKKKECRQQFMKFWRDNGGFGV